jgi:hypothetical protein
MENLKRRDSMRRMGGKGYIPGATGYSTTPPLTIGLSMTLEPP